MPRIASRVDPAILTRQMSEDDLFEAIRELAVLLGWRLYHTYDSRKSVAGFPDLVLVNRMQRRVLFVELKGPRGRVTAEQQAWIDALVACGEEAGVWWPQDWHDGTIEAALRGQA